MGTRRQRIRALVRAGWTVQSAWRFLHLQHRWQAVEGDPGGFYTSELAAMRAAANGGTAPPRIIAEAWREREVRPGITEHWIEAVRLSDGRTLDPDRDSDEIDRLRHLDQYTQILAMAVLRGPFPAMAVLREAFLAMAVGLIKALRRLGPPLADPRYPSSTDTAADLPAPEARRAVTTLTAAPTAPPAAISAAA